MTLIEAIEKADALCPNGYQNEEKIDWINTLDGLVKKNIIDTHTTEVEWSPYTINDLDKTLLITSPYEEAYIFWLEGKISYYNSELTRYNNAITEFGDLYSAFANAYHRSHTSKTVNITYK